MRELDFYAKGDFIFPAILIAQFKLDIIEDAPLLRIHFPLSLTTIPSAYMLFLWEILFYSAS